MYLLVQPQIANIDLWKTLKIHFGKRVKKKFPHFQLDQSL